MFSKENFIQLLYFLIFLFFDFFNNFTMRPKKLLKKLVKTPKSVANSFSSKYTSGFVVVQKIKISIPMIWNSLSVPISFYCKRKNHWLFIKSSNLLLNTSNLTKIFFIKMYKDSRAIHIITSRLKSRT